ncbi:MAG: prlC [Gammaproteobacteria bacterium]|jgi:oligopeptidase A|nr:prlC [Gammaproteobacteria bacterium]
MTNPLLSFYTLPPFSDIKAEHVLPAVETVLAENRRQIEALLSTLKDYTWETLIEPLEKIHDRLHQVWSPVCHLHAVCDSPALRKAYHAALSKISDYETQISYDPRLYQAYQHIADSESFNDFSIAQKTVIQNALRDFHLSGVDLNSHQKNHYQQLCKDLASLTSQFSDNVIDSTQSWTKHISDSFQLSGLPEHTIAAAAQNAQEKSLSGWLLTLDYPCYHSVMTYADDRTLRETFYSAYYTRASDQGAHDKRFDNTRIMDEILAKRHALAELLGFRNYAAYSVATKMVRSVEAVLSFLEDLLKKTKLAAEQELKTLQTFAQQNFDISELKAWDISYYSEKLRQQTFSLNQETLRPYFALENVLKGFFTIIEKLFGMTAIEEDVQAWHSDVRFFAIYDKDHRLRGKIYLDLFARKNKRDGAWMDECQTRRKEKGKVQYPIAYLVCNFTPPLKGHPALLTHEEVETLFHEFGHCLHHTLTQIDYADVSGISGVPWDAVELPSQFMENWAWQKESLALFAKHHETDDPLPATLFENLLNAKHFQSAMHLLRQLEFALFDFELHTAYTPGKQNAVETTLTQVRQRTAILALPAYNRFAHTFSHIFAGEYAAGYYSYAWAEVLAADAFSEFLKKGIFNQALGQQFLECILEKGGSEPPLDLFIAFCGRHPSVEALLLAKGIIPPTPSTAL